MEFSLSYLMGATNITDEELQQLGVSIIGIKPSGSRMLQIPTNKVHEYMDLMEKSLDNGFWNEVVGKSEIIFGFKHKDGTFERIRPSDNTEEEISKLCTEFNADPIEKTANVYRYLSENEFYADMLNDNYYELVNR